MELTLAEEIRALLEMHQKESPQPRGKCFMQFWCAFPALAAKMLAELEKCAQLQSIGANICAQREIIINQKNDIIDALQSTMAESPRLATARIAELKEDAVRWETRYRFAQEQFTDERNYHIHTLKEMQAAQKECDRLRWEAECLQVTVR